MKIQGRRLLPGSVEGSLLRLDEPLSFWGGLDPTTGEIIDRSHPQIGQSLAGRIVAMTASRGSSGTPGVLGESLRLGTGPTAIILTAPDINLVAGAFAAEALYGILCPIVVVSIDDFASLVDGSTVSV